MSTIRIESIYDVALAKLLLEEIDGLNLSSPSKDIQRLLGVKQNIEIHDVHISDLDQRVGVQLQGDKNMVKVVENALVKKLPYVVVHRMSVQKDSIYLATIERVTRKNLVFLDLGETKGILFGLRDKNYREGNTLIVQVKELPSEPDKLPVCSEQINLSGDYVILEKSKDSNFVRVSRKINGPQRETLHDIGKRVKPESFGIIMRTSAAEAPEEDIAAEVVLLLEKWQSILAEKKEADTKQVSSGDTIVEISFNFATKIMLDDVRGALETVIPKFHPLRSYSMATSYALEFGGYFATAATAPLMSDKLYEMVFEKDYTINNSTKINLQKIVGTIMEESMGKITDISEDGVIHTRLNIDKRRAEEDMSNYVLFEGDYIDIYLKEGSWTIFYKYYGGDGELIGSRVRIVSPVDLIFKGRFRAVDLGIDIYLPNEDGSEVDVIRDEEPAEMVKLGFYAQGTADRIEEIIAKVTKEIKSSDGPIIVS